MEVILVLMILITIALLVLAIYAIVYEIRKNRSYSTYEKVEKEHSEALHCPYCNEEMESGYAIAMRGLAFRRCDQSRTSFVMNRILSNTMNFSFGLRENKAWHCAKCNLLTIDHNALIGKK